MKQGGKRLTFTCGLLMSMCAISLLGTSVATASVMPDSISFGTEESVDAEANAVNLMARIVAGPEGTQFGLEYALPSWPNPLDLDGSPLYVTGVALAGLGSVRPADPEPPLPPMLVYRNVCDRGIFSAVGSSFWIELPANATTSVIFTVAPTYNSWPGTDYRVLFSTFETDDYAAPRTLAGIVDAANIAPVGVRISMWTRGAKARYERQGMSPSLAGRTDPPLPFRRIALRAVRSTRTGSVSLAQWDGPKGSVVGLGAVRTDGRGRFRLGSRQILSSRHSRPFLGRYAFVARSAPAPGIAADWNCGPFFTARSTLKIDESGQ
jgi:hypothetical protein